MLLSDVSIEAFEDWVNYYETQLPDLRLLQPLPFRASADGDSKLLYVRDDKGSRHRN